MYFFVYHSDNKYKVTGPQTLSLKLSNHQKWRPYQILGGKTVKNVQIDPQIWNMINRPNVTLSVRV